MIENASLLNIRWITSVLLAIALLAPTVNSDADKIICPPLLRKTFDAGGEGVIKTGDNFYDIYTNATEVNDSEHYWYCFMYLGNIPPGSWIGFTTQQFITDSKNVDSNICWNWSNIQIKTPSGVLLHRFCPNQPDSQTYGLIISNSSDYDCTRDLCKVGIYFEDILTERSSSTQERTGAKLTLSYRVADVLHGNMDFRSQSQFRLVSHKDFNYSASSAQDVLTVATISVGQNDVRYDVEFEYFDPETDGYVEFQHVAGYKHGAKHNIPVVKIYRSNSSHILHLYPSKHNFIIINSELRQSSGFCIKITVVQQNSTAEDYGCDTAFIKNAVVEMQTKQLYNMTCNDGYAVVDSQDTSHRVACDRNGTWHWQSFRPCTESATASHSTTVTIHPITPEKTTPTTERKISVTTTVDTPSIDKTTMVESSITTKMQSSTYHRGTESGQHRQTTIVDDQMKNGNLIPIVAGLVGAIVLIIIIITIVVVLLRRRGRNMRHKPGSRTGEMITNNNNEEGEVRIPLTQRNYEEGGNIYEMTDDMPDVVNHTPMLPPAKGAASAAQPNVPEDGGELDYENSMTISDKKQDDTITDVYAPILASQKKPKEDVVIMEENDLYGT